MAGKRFPPHALNAVDTPEYRDVVDEALVWGRGQSGDFTRVAAATGDRLAVSVGVELSFNVAAPVARAHQIIDAYKQRGDGPERVFIKARG